MTPSFDSAGVRCDATLLAARSSALDGPRGRPCLVMAHGFGCTRDSGLQPFARRFSALGCDVLTFDYRGFGTSAGEPRQYVSHRRQRADWHAAVAFARTLPGVDAERIALWGTSYSGGHVLAVAADDPRIAAVVSQGRRSTGWRYCARPPRTRTPSPTRRRACSARRFVTSPRRCCDTRR